MHGLKVSIVKVNGKGECMMTMEMFSCSRAKGRTGIEHCLAHVSPPAMIFDDLGTSRYPLARQARHKGRQSC